MVDFELLIELLLAGILNLLGPFIRRVFLWLGGIIEQVVIALIINQPLEAPANYAQALACSRRAFKDAERSLIQKIVELTAEINLDVIWGIREIIFYFLPRRRIRPILHDKRNSV